MNPFRTLWQSPRALLLTAVAAAVLVQTWMFMHSAAVRGFGSSDAGVKLLQVQSVLRTGRLDASIDYAGEVYDPEHSYSPFVSPWFFWQGGQPYSEYISPFIWISAPLYALMGHVGLLILPWLCAAGVVILSGWLAWHVRADRSAAWVPIIVGLSSPLPIYGAEFWEHTPGTLLTLLTLIGVVKAWEHFRANAPKSSAAWLILSGAAAGLGLTMHAGLYVFPIAVAIGLVLARSGLPAIRTLLMLAIGGLLTAGPWWAYQAIRWGSPLGPRVAQNVPWLGGTDMLSKIGDATGHNGVMLWPARGEGLEVLAIAGLVTILLALVMRLLSGQSQVSDFADHGLSRATPAPVRIGWLLTIGILVIAGITTWRVVNWQAVPDQRPNDLLTTFPILLMLLWPIGRSVMPGDWRVRFLAIASVAFVLLVLIISPFDGGIQWGPRFLLPIVPPLAVAIAARLGSMWREARHRMRVALALAFAGLLLAGGYSTWNGFEFIHSGQVMNAQLSEIIENTPGRVVVTDVWFLPQGASYAFADKMWFLAEDGKSIFNLIQLLRKKTGEPEMIYLSSLTWNHFDPIDLMGGRITQIGERQHVDAPGQYIEIGRYTLNR